MLGGPQTEGDFRLQPRSPGTLVENRLKERGSCWKAKGKGMVWAFNPYLQEQGALLI